ncbi:MAG: hypothetical protein HC880_13315 [Bacteroidia bacterium]|nr:hypothetical protein [Bacteroidia bacterium]
MTSLDLNPFSEHSLSGDNFLTIPSSFSTLVERIQEYLVAQYEGFLINEVGKIKYHNALIGYQIQLQRGNLMVDLLFDHIGELLNAHFDY